MSLKTTSNFTPIFSAPDDLTEHFHQDSREKDIQVSSDNKNPRLFGLPEYPTED